MNETSILEEIKNHINNDKEVLAILPQNNVRNRKKYQLKLEEILLNYQNNLDNVYSLIKDNYQRLIDVKENNELGNLDNELDDFYQKFALFNEYNTSYEKMGLDVIVHKLRKYYKDNLEHVNEVIGEAIDKFKMVGVLLKADDFFYSIYAHQYMRVLISEKDAGNLISQALKDEFEKIYWKCPDLIKHIVLNIIYLYYFHKKTIDKYYENVRKDLIVDCGDFQSLKNSFNEKIKNYRQAFEIDKYNILNMFLNGDKSIGDFLEEKINKLVLQLTDNDTDPLFYDYLHKLKFSIIEFKNYLKYEYLVNDVKEIYKEKDKYKNIVKNKYKEIVKNEKNIKKLNKKVLFFSKKNLNLKVDEVNNQINLLINDLDRLYSEFDLDIFREKVVLSINENSSLYDVLSLISSYDNYIIDCNKRNDIEGNSYELICDIHKYLYEANNNLIDNLLFTVDNNLPMIISDKYKLMNFKIETEMLDVNNLDSLLGMIENIILYYNILKSGYKIEELEFVCDAKKIIELAESNVAS